MSMGGGCLQECGQLASWPFQNNNDKQNRTDLSMKKTMFVSLSLLLDLNALHSKVKLPKAINRR